MKILHVLDNIIVKYYHFLMCQVYLAVLLVGHDSHIHFLLQSIFHTPNTPWSNIVRAQQITEIKHRLKIIETKVPIKLSQS